MAHGNDCEYVVMRKTWCKQKRPLPLWRMAHRLYLPFLKGTDAGILLWMEGPLVKIPAWQAARKSGLGLIHFFYLPEGS